MPRGDRTGPLGEGPMTGRQLGYGAGYDSPGFTMSLGGRPGARFRGQGAGTGRGFGRGFFRRGRGTDHGYARRYFHPDQPESAHGVGSVIESLRSEIGDLRDKLNMIIEQLQSNSAKVEK
jgi:hypothetical protein